MDQLHAAPPQVMDVARFGAKLGSARSRALFKGDDLEVIRIVLRQGQTLPPHRVPGGVSLHCLEGHLEVLLGQTVHEIKADQLIHLPSGLPHAVRALEDSSALVSIVLCKS